MAEKERYQNPVVGDTINLRLFSYNSNNRANFNNIQKIEIYYLDPNQRTEANPQGRTLVQTISGDNVVNLDTGLYQISLPIDAPNYVIGNYADVWHVRAEEDSQYFSVENHFRILPDLWYVTSTPITYDFNFSIKPQRIRKGSKRWMLIEVTPNISDSSDLKKYYENLAVISPLKITIKKSCQPCGESDENIIVEKETIQMRENCVGYYFLDTEDYDEGIYMVTIEMDFAENVYVSDELTIQIFN